MGNRSGRAAVCLVFMLVIISHAGATLPPWVKTTDTKTTFPVSQNLQTPDLSSFITNSKEDSLPASTPVPYTVIRTTPLNFFNSTTNYPSQSRGYTYLIGNYTVIAASGRGGDLDDDLVHVTIIFFPRSSMFRASSLIYRETGRTEGEIDEKVWAMAAWVPRANIEKLRALREVRVVVEDKDYNAKDVYDNAYNRALWQISAEYKASLNSAQLKLGGQILELIDPDYPRTPSSTTAEGLRNIFIKYGILIPGDKVPAGTGDILGVYIYIAGGTGHDIVDQFAYKVEYYATDETGRVVAWIPIKDLENLAANPDVIGISTPIPTPSSDSLSQVRR